MCRPRPPRAFGGRGNAGRNLEAGAGAVVGHVDHHLVGHSYTPEAAVVSFRFAFEELELHRLQIAVIPRNVASRRVAEKLGLRNEGTAERYLEINGNWEDHVRYAITAEEWAERRDSYLKDWVL